MMNFSLMDHTHQTPVSENIINKCSDESRQSTARLLGEKVGHRVSRTDPLEDW
ncbi:hypothetical protein VSU01S_17620 [Vibrio superstes NBRC 103154]|uniref:Uncharacterized protein n=1 Tax=Vibrio superstes NBRC 103154 TaxID=1219062 RepID=A0A511QR12_9VIBR|nr:hypothetical protein VSU01S_17620 [Vibrio superstes NBRC 103154]